MGIFKLIFIGASLMALLSCNQNSYEKQVLPNYLKDINISDNQNIFGEWTMCSNVSGGKMTQMNVCPIIVFKLNGMGSVEHNSVTSENFMWTLKKNNLKIIDGYKNSNSIFQDTSYYVSFYKEKDGIDLIIHHNDDSYNLSKSLNSQ